MKFPILDNAEIFVCCM